jgi:hypothetical protein
VLIDRFELNVHICLVVGFLIDFRTKRGNKSGGGNSKLTGLSSVIEKVQRCRNSMMLTPKSTNRRTRFGYESSVATLARRLFFEKLEELNVIDSTVDRLGIRIMIDMGMTKSEHHADGHSFLQKLELKS